MMLSLQGSKYVVLPVNEDEEVDERRVPRWTLSPVSV